MCKCDKDNPNKSCDKCRGGRPTKFEELDLKLVKKLSEVGLSDFQMYTYFNVVHSTWYKWKAEHKEFSDALKSWKKNADKNVVRSLFQRAMGYSHPEDKIFKSAGEEPVIVKTIKHYPPDTKAMEIWLRNRNPKEWNVPQNVDLKVDDVKLVPPDLPEETEETKE